MFSLIFVLSLKRTFLFSFVTVDTNMSGTFSVNFDHVKYYMTKLTELRAEVDSGDWHRREQCIALHEEVSKMLLPLFKDLADMDMLVLWTKAHGNVLSDVSNLEVTGVNGGIQLSKKE